MIENLPGYISIIFILTTSSAVGFLFYALRQKTSNTLVPKILLFLIPLWLLLQATLAFTGFYLKTDAFPPRIFAFAVFPAFLFIILLFIFTRGDFVNQLSLKILTLLSVIRIPVELVLFWLFQHNQVPQIMTFEGRNPDILSGISALLVYWLAFRDGKVNRTILLIWNIFAFSLLVNIVTNAALSVPSPIQQFAFEQPNRAVLYFPFIWLPSVVVPIVMFSHLAAFWHLLKTDSKP